MKKLIKYIPGEVIIYIKQSDIESLDYAIEILTERDNKNREGMYVSPNKETKAISQLRLLKYQIEKELRG
jgi:hypothetical protein